MLFVERCALCDRIGTSPCERCIRRLSPPPDLANPDGLESFVSLFAYEDAGRRLVTASKFHRRRGALRWMGERLAEAVDDFHPQVITWVPSSLVGRHKRGFETGELLAREVGKRLRIPVRPLLERTGRERQSDRDREHRYIGPSLRPNRWAARHLDVASVLVVDDVSTTGASLAAAARVLTDRCGVRFVSGATAARTPLRR